MSAGAAVAPGMASSPPHERAPLGVLSMDAAQVVVSADEAFLRIFGCTAKDIVGRGLDEIISPSDRRAFRALHTGLSRYAGGFVDFTAELRLGGTAVHARLRVTRAVSGWTAYAERIEEQDLVYHLLLAQERWSAIFQNSQDGIAFLSQENRIVEFNRRFYELMQFRSPHGVLLSEDALANRPLSALLPRGMLDELRAAVDDPSLTEEVTPASIGGRQLEVRMNRTVLPVRGVVGTCIVVRDVSERKQLEELRVRQAEAHYAGMAEIANNLLHNLGNMCGSILFSAEELVRALEKSAVARLQRAGHMLKEHEHELVPFLTDDPKGKLLPEFYWRIGESLEAERTRVTLLVKDLTGKVQLIKEAIASQQTYAKGTRFIETIDLDLVVDDAVGIERAALERHGVRLVRTGGNVGIVYAQRSKLVHVLLNVMRNAIDAMDASAEPRVLTVETGREASGRGFVHITDTGKGIAQ
jgi:PAS domain S-box-containing protein